jgi:hypothetical protein
MHPLENDEREPAPILGELLRDGRKSLIESNASHRRTRTGNDGNGPRFPRVYSGEEIPSLIPFFL